MTVMIDANKRQLKLLDGILKALKENNAIEAYDLGYEQNKDFFTSRLKEIENGKATLLSHDEVWTQIEQRTKG
jgi:hypothetical protein